MASQPEGCWRGVAGASAASYSCTPASATWSDATVALALFLAGLQSLCGSLSRRLRARTCHLHWGKAAIGQRKEFAKVSQQALATDQNDEADIP